MLAHIQSQPLTTDSAASEIVVCDPTSNIGLERRGSAATLSLLLVFASASAFAQTSANTDVTLAATVLMGISITSSGGSDGVGNLDFGLVTTGNTGAINARTGSTAGMYTIGGNAGATVTASYSSPMASLSDGAGHQLAFTPQVVGGQTAESQSAAIGLSNGLQVVIGSSDSYYIWLGGTIYVPTSQVGGTYNGIFNLTISY